MNVRLSKSNSELKFEQIEYASFDRRLISFTIDIAIVFLIITVITMIHSYFTKTDLESVMQSFFIEYGGKKEPITIDKLWFYMRDQGVLYEYLIWQIFIPFIVLLFYIVGSWIIFSGSTLGKLITKCKIVNAKNLKRSSIIQYIVRFMTYPLLIITLGFGVLMIVFRKDTRGLHDIISGTAVIVKRKARQAIT